MPDDLYERDILAWSAQQADLLRRFILDQLLTARRAELEALVRAASPMYPD